jgi:hypothetical protein
MCTTIKTMLSQLSVATAPQLGIRSAHAPDTIPAKSAVRKNCDTTMTAVTCNPRLRRETKQCELAFLTGNSRLA